MPAFAGFGRGHNTKLTGFEPRSLLGSLLDAWSSMQEWRCIFGSESLRNPTSVGSRSLLVA